MTIQTLRTQNGILFEVLLANKLIYPKSKIGQTINENFGMQLENLN